MSIFRNQPPHTHFNKCFEDDPRDPLFLSLNEIDPLYLREDQLRDDSAFEQQHVLRDPRTGKAVQQVFYDHATEGEKRHMGKDAAAAGPKIFHAGAARSSSLTKAEHAACLRVQHAWQQRHEVDELDLLLWRRLQPQRQREKQEMLKFVYEYAQSHKEHMYAPAKRLVELYKKWYARRVEVLLQREPETTFNTHLGLPHVRVCSVDGKGVEIAHVQLLQRKGWMPVWQPDRDEYRKLHAKLETFAALYQSADTRGESEFPINDIRAHMTQSSATPSQESSQFFVPLESLLFLLTAGEYCDLPSEVLLDIEIDLDRDTKRITFQKPLPARHCGFHTHKQMLQQAMAACRSVSGGATKWHCVRNNQVRLATDVAASEIVATQLQKYAAPLEFEAYLAKYKQAMPRSTHSTENAEKINAAALVKWSLVPEVVTSSDAAADHSLTLFSTLPPPVAASNDVASESLACHSLKLEYKPQFGCEVMTKHELLEVWLKMRLLNAPQAHCTHLSATEFETQLEQSLSLAKVEQQLSDVYQIKMPQLLAKLDEFLRLLLNISAGGRYMLRYNPRFRDKLMLCAPSREITQNTVSLHALLRSEPSDLLFMTQLQFLPIADDLCSIVHLHHQVLPCAFLPNSKAARKFNSSMQAAKTQPKQKMVNDRQWLLKRSQKKAELAKGRSTLWKKARKNESRSRKRKRQAVLKKAAGQESRNDETELQRDMETDKLLFG